MTERPEPLVYDAAKASERLGGFVSARWLQDHARAGDIPHSRVGGKRVWSDADLRQLLELCHVDPETRGRKVQRVRRPSR